MNYKKYDVAIIGGGAAGLCAAVAIKSQMRDADVVVIEQLNRVGKKLITTGNGRCNITNKNIELSRYHSENVEFAGYALEKYNNQYTEGFFEKLGVIFVYDEDLKGYPYSLQASSVVDSLRFALDDLKVDTLIDTKVISIKKSSDIFELLFENNNKITAKTVLATGGLYSGGESVGSDGSVFEILKGKGYRTVFTTPSIVQIKTENAVTKSLKGIKVNATATLLSNGEALRSETGEVLFCDYGLSGPPIMQISRQVDRISSEKKIILDFMPEHSREQVSDMINERINLLHSRTLEEFFTGMLNKRVGQAILKLCGKKLSEYVSTLDKKDVLKITEFVKGMPFKVMSSCGFKKSQVTAGGLCTADFNSQTMMSKRDEGLFAAGEILDIDGDCGGFNLQWAWSSAFCAAQGIIDYLKCLG